MRDSEHTESRWGGLQFRLTAPVTFQTRGQRIARGVVALLVILGGITSALYFTPPARYVELLKYSLFALAYLLVAYVVRVNPNHSNLGAVDGLIDNPMRISDGWNRQLVNFAIVLLPGQLLVGSVVSLFAEAPERRSDA